MEMGQSMMTVIDTLREHLNDDWIVGYPGCIDDVISSLLGPNCVP